MKVLTLLLSLALGSLSFAAKPPAATPANMAPAAQQILDLFRAHDVVFLGEIHGVHEQRALFAEIAKASAGVDAIATEAVWTSEQSVLDNFLATGDEKNLFFDEGWFNSFNIRSAFRALRANRTPVCAIDIDFYGPDKMEKRRPELAARLKAMPADVLKLILKQQGRTVAQLVKAGDPVERDYLMGVAIDACLKAHRKVLVHAGMDHTTSLDPVYRKKVINEEWDAAQWLSYINPQAKYAVVHNVIDVIADLDPAGKAFTEYYRQKKAAAPFLLNTAEVPAGIKKLMTKDGVETWRRRDFVVVGPAGSVDLKAKP